MPSPTEFYESYGKLGDNVPRDWSSIVGIVTAIVGNVLISFALNTQRYAHIRIDRDFKNKQDPEAKAARKHLPKQLRNYGSAVQQEEAAEQRQRLNEAAQIPSELTGNTDGPFEHNGIGNGKAAGRDQEQAQEHEQEYDDNGRQSYLKSPWWWLGIILMTIGEAGNFLAYGFAPASIVSPLGVVALISNCLIAPLMLKEQFRQRDFWGVLIAIGGAVTVVLSAKTSEKKLGPDALWHDIKRWEFLTYVAITLVCIVLLMVASPRYGQRTVLIDLGLVGLFGGYTALSTKGVASLLSGSLYRAFGYPIFYVLVLVLVTSAVMQIRYLNRALQNFASTQVIPVQFVLFTLSVIIGSAVLYRDFERTDLDHALKFIFGCLLTFGGVYLITSGRKHGDDEEEDEIDIEYEAEQIHLLDEENQYLPSTPPKRESTLHIDTDQDVQHLKLTPTSSHIPSIAVTPAASAEDLNKNPWLSSTDHLARIQSKPDIRPQTPRGQTLPPASTSQTPFFTPATTARDHLSRAVSTPGQPQTPTRRTLSPTKSSPEAQSLNKRSSISRLLPGPILQPLSSSLSGVVADRIRRGEGLLSPSPLRRARSGRHTVRPRLNAPTASGTDLEAVMSLDNEATRSMTGEQSPLLKRTLSHDAETMLGGNSKRTKGRLRSMSETLTSLVTGRRNSQGESEHSDPQLSR